MVEYHIWRTVTPANRDIVKNAMDYINSKVPCITFHPKVPFTKNWVEIYEGGDTCSSEYGKRGGKQDINLNSACFESGIKTPVHELLHTLGFVHEHNRPDRNRHISINWDNFKPGKDTFFSKRKQGNDLEKEGVTEKGLVDMKNMPYDVLSVMHYGPQHEEYSEDDKDVFTYLYGLPDDTWLKPDEKDPLSVVDQVELALAYGCTVNQETLVQYV